ncbi:acyl carrier protein [Actinophytocola xinjiangensis]|uniref:Acyl carrier protein n=1 Tax=Actinophytocola xinjiangensis TaxID=485602 RepID=A0A7Z1AW01_9PSEU|nr:phosphopantetheine-binding protein [Actinophytocola xinjiangensis]OLF07359.1 acyl carrier protein [Actinophytocola xinjiangensis]
MTQLTDTEIVTRIRSVLGRTLGDAVDHLAQDADLAQALGERYDSLTAMECITAIEGEFDIEVDFVAHDVRHWFATVARMARFVGDRLEDRALLRSER